MQRDSVVEIGEMIVLFDEDSEMEQTINGDIERVGYGEGNTGGVVGAKKTRSLYIKQWNQEEDLLAQMRFALEPHIFILLISYGQ